MKIILLLFGIIQVFTIIDPSIVLQTFKSSLTDNLKMLTLDIGRTVNGRSIIAYGITKIPKTSHPPIAAQLKDYNSILLTSYFNPKDQVGVDLIISLMDYWIKTHNSDYYLSYVLEHGVIWVVPFVNIDGYETYFRNESQQKLQKWGLLVKNLNRSYRNAKKNTNEHQDCENQLQYGVNIDSNFLQHQYPITDVCSTQYPGPQPFSEAQSKAIRYMYSLFRITTAVNIEGFGNRWVYPYTDQTDETKLQQSLLYFLYKDIKIKLRKQNYSIGLYKQLFKKTKKGGYIDWAVDKGTLAFTYFYGTVFRTPKNIEDSQAKNSFPVFDMLIKKNSPVYNKYRNEQNTKLYIESICLISFEIMVEVVSGKDSSEKMTRFYDIIPGQLLEVDFENYLILHNLGQEIHFQVTGSLIKQTIHLEKLNVLEKKEEDILQNQQKNIFTFLIIILGAFGGIYVLNYIFNNYSSKFKVGERKRKSDLLVEKEEEQKLRS